MDRRTFLHGLGAVTVAPLVLTSCDPGPLQPANAHGLRLPYGFGSRVIARSGKKVPGTGYTYPWDPDGAAVFPRPGGGWVLCVNHEDRPGGASSIAFAPDGTIDGAWSILSGTDRNCAGGATPWGTWLSCEEVPDGLVWECDPQQPGQGIARPALGAFNHEAAAVNPANGDVYMTEDEDSSRLWRFRPDRAGDLSSGSLKVRLAGGGWGAPSAPNAQTFNRGEGCWWDAVNGRLVFVTTGDRSVWQYVPGGAVDRIYSGDGVLTSPDNVAVHNGVPFVCEDRGNLEIVLLREDGSTFPVVRQKNGHADTELTGVCFLADPLVPGKVRMYFSSQDGFAQDARGYTFEVTGPWGAFTVPAW